MKQNKTSVLPPIMKESPILDLEDLLRDKSLSVIGIVGDKHQAKSMTFYNIIHILRKLAPLTNIVAFELKHKIEGVLYLNTIFELAAIRNSFIIIDELKRIVDTDNRREINEFLKLLQTIKHANNTIIMGGLAHNYNGKLSGELDALIFKQTTLISVVQRSMLDHILKTMPTQEGEAGKNRFMLTMPIQGALVYHPTLTKKWHYITIPYLEECDTKRGNESVIKWEH